MTYSEWVSSVLNLGRRRGYRMTAEEFRQPSSGQIGHVIYGIADACGLYFTGTSAEGIERYVTPEQFFYAAPCERTVIENALASHFQESKANWERKGRYVLRIPARAVSMALERLF